MWSAFVTLLLVAAYHFSDEPRKTQTANQNLMLGFPKQDGAPNSGIDKKKTKKTYAYHSYLEFISI